MNIMLEENIKAGLNIAMPKHITAPAPIIKGHVLLLFLGLAGSLTLALVSFKLSLFCLF
jgi:hypothetical protein